MSSHESRPGVVTSVGALGIDHTRSDHRSVGTYAEPVRLMREAARLRRGMSSAANTRAQIKCPGNPDLVPTQARHLIDAVFTPTVGPADEGVIFMSYNTPARQANQIDTLALEWEVARNLWCTPASRNPLDRLSGLAQKGYSIGQRFQRSDIPQLATIWQPFGWTEQGIEEFFSAYDPEDPMRAGWFTCVRDPSGTIQAAAKAEQLSLGPLTFVETTEWGTTRVERGKGLGTGAVIALNQNILQRPPNSPFVIMAEANLAPDLPGHRVARDAGFVPAGADMTSPTPNHVLRAHVSVDGQLRNFLPVQLTPQAVATLYSRI